MLLTPKSRKVIRQAMTTSLTASFADYSNRVYVYGYQKANLKGLSPAIRVMGDGTDRGSQSGSGFGNSIGGTMSKYYYIIQLWVLYVDEAGTWYDEVAEDQLDGLEQKVAQWVEGEHPDAPWQMIQYADKSVMDVREVGGNAYLVEDIPVMVHVFPNPV